MRLINAATVPRAEKLLRRAQCAPSLAVGDCVKVSGAKVGVYLQVALADPLAAPFRPAVGIVTRKYTSTLCLVQSAGPMAGVVSGLVPGAAYYLGASGQLVSSPPASPARVQQMGVAWDADEFLVHWYDEGGAAAVADFDVDRMLVLRWNPHDPPVHEEPSIAIQRSTGNAMVLRP